MKLLSQLEKVFDFILVTMLTASFAVAGVLYLFQIVLRFSHHAIFWIDPLVQYLFILASLLGAAYAVKFYENIKIELFRKIAEAKYVRKSVDLVAALLSVFLIYIFYERLLEEYHNPETSDFGVQKWVLEIPYLYLFLASSFYYVLNVFRDPKTESAV
jgi:TRAP-type C4-dicarboxylate transport system permease small subunit